MTCKYCGSDQHRSEDCPALHLTRFLLDQPYEKEHLPDFVGVMTEEELLSKTEEELHDEVKQINKLRKS